MLARPCSRSCTASRAPVLSNLAAGKTRTAVAAGQLPVLAVMTVVTAMTAATAMVMVMMVATVAMVAIERKEMLEVCNRTSRDPD